MIALISALSLCLTASVIIAGTEDSTDVCSAKNSCPGEEEVEWETENPAKQIRSWITQQKSKNKITFCREEKEDSPLTENALPLYRVGGCGDLKGRGTSFQFSGKRDKDNLFKGKGEVKFDRADHPRQGKKQLEIGVENDVCLIENPFMSVKSVVGQFKEGLPVGEVRLGLFDFGELTGQSAQGVLHGKVVLRNKAGGIVFVGRYKDGVPHGWAWVFSPDDPDIAAGALYVQFNKGLLVEDNAVFVMPSLERGIVGSYDHDQGAVVGGHQFKIDQFRDLGCVRHIHIPKFKGPGEKMAPLPLRVKPLQGSVSVVSTRLLLFNRVAKVGSQSLIRLMVELSGTTEDYVVKVDQRTEEKYNSLPWEQLELAQQLASFSKPTVWVRHFNFLDFDSLGLAFPNYINLVRDPVERVISNFYYRRAGWNIVEQHLAFPDQPLPDPKFLRRDFESCVQEGDPECSYIQDSINTAGETGDHRRQMMQYCGQHPLCARFNNKEVLEIAKQNVLKSFVVVGVLELWDETLEVLEHTLPYFFKGAHQMYRKKKREIRGMAQNMHKGMVSEEVKMVVRANFSHEQEFYQFCKDRLLHQLAEVRKNKIN